MNWKMLLALLIGGSFFFCTANSYDTQPRQTLVTPQVIATSPVYATLHGQPWQQLGRLATIDTNQDQIVDILMVDSATETICFRLPLPAGHHTTGSVMRAATLCPAEYAFAENDIAAAGDVDGDGQVDWFVGRPKDSSYGTNAGAIDLILGRPK